tara:strand:- start:24682 stop:25218 length:537 start_codon:yes stop_codon:yes gene_type:complete
MQFKNRFIGFFIISGLVLSSFGLPQNIQKKIQKEFEKFFDSSEITLKSVAVTAKLNAQLPTKISKDNFFKLSKESKFIGYAFVDKAPSKTAKFDYLVIFDTNLKITHSKILIYREEYGGEIGSKRWLQQFLGKTIGDRVALDDNIDGIAGATISVRSMTHSMDNLLQTITILQNNKVL